MTDYLYILVNDEKAGKSQTIVCDNGRQVNSRVNELVTFLATRKGYQILQCNVSASKEFKIIRYVDKRTNIEYTVTINVIKTDKISLFRF
jgi:lysophospholipid acyltransferase (LPLAT)-like uncharacterized protein